VLPHPFLRKKSLFVSHDGIAQRALFSDLATKSVVFKPEEEHSSSYGGAVLIKGVDGCLGLTESRAECPRDPRLPGKIAHTFHELLQQRVLTIALGHA
jgi:hypothetical protein